jgi:hypothetical protein
MCSSGSGNFYHLAMCDPDWRTSREEHIEPPLGWVLWLPSRRQIREVLEVCGNNDERWEGSSRRWSRKHLALLRSAKPSWRSQSQDLQLKGCRPALIDGVLEVKRDESAPDTPLTKASTRDLSSFPSAPVSHGTSGQK